MADDVQREIGAFEARLDHYEKQLSEVRADVKQLLAYANRTKGGWLALAAVGTLGGAFGAFLGKLVAMVKGGG